MNGRHGLIASIAGLLFLALLPARAYTALDGGVTAPILSYSVGARAYAMGGAFTALVDDTTATWWNPAGLTEIHKQEIAAYGESLFMNSYLLFVGYSYPIWNVGVASGSVMYLGSDGIVGTSEPYPGVVQLNSDTYSAYQLLINLSFAQKLAFYKRFVPMLKYFDAGATLKFYTAGTSGTLTGTGRLGVGLDLGVKYYPTHITDPKWEWFRNFVFALKINNLVPPTVRVSDVRDWYLWDLNLGILYHTIYDTLNITVDVQQTLFKKSLPNPKVGIEYTVYRVVKLRAGYNGELSFGIGVNFEDFKFDYAFGYNFDLGILHHISLVYNFGEIIP